jgi:WD40 repeat protein
MLLSLNGHLSGAVNAVRFSSDGNYCMTAGDDRMVMLWNPHREDPSKIGKHASIIEYVLDMYIHTYSYTHPETILKCTYRQWSAH